MTTLKKKNPFVLPEKLNPANLDDEYDYKRFEQWVSELPIGNVSKTAHAIHHELNRHNHLEMSPLERFDAIEKLLPALSFVFDKLWAHCSGKPIPLSKQNRLVARLYFELLVGVIVAYKTVMAQFHDDSFTGYFLHKRSRSESSRRALYFLGEVLLLEYSIYRVSPKFVWKEIHGIYHYAVSNALLHKEIEVLDDDLVGHMSIKDIYKRIQLLALSDPNGLLRGEAKKVNDAIVRWLPKVSIVPVDEDISSQHVFIVDATKDAPPYMADADNREQVKIGSLLITDKLDDILQQEIGEIKGKSETNLRPVDAATVSLFSKLRKRWVQNLQPREKRTKRSGIIEATRGLESLHWLFGGWQLQRDEDSDLSVAFGSVKEKELGQPVAAIEQDEFIIDADAELIAAIEEGLEQAYPDIAAEKKVDLEFYNAVVDDKSRSNECMCADESRRGCYLTWPEEGEYKAHVGELIGLNSKENIDFDSSWRLGIIRWACIQNNDLMGLGIELLEGDIESIRLDHWHDKDSVAKSMLGFQQKIGGKINSIIASPFFFGDKDRFLLTDSVRQLQVIPGQIIECTDAIMRFKIRIDSNESGVTDTGSNKHSSLEDPLSSLWDDL